LSVGELHVQFLGPLDNSESLSYTDVLSDFSCVDSIVHKKKFNVLFTSDEHLFESATQGVSCFTILLATNLWHFLGSLKSSSGKAINTTHLSVRVGL